MKVSATPMPLAERAALRLHGPAEQYSGLGKSKLYDLARQGEIELFKVDGRTLVSRASLDNLLARRSVLK
jgi:hypothetical protein